MLIAQNRNKDDVWNVTFGGAALGVFAGMGHGTLNSVVMGAFKYSTILSAAYLVLEEVKKENLGWRRPEEEIKKRFAYARNKD